MDEIGSQINCMKVKGQIVQQLVKLWPHRLVSQLIPGTKLIQKRIQKTHAWTLGDSLDGPMNWKSCQIWAFKSRPCQARIFKHCSSIIWNWFVIHAYPCCHKISPYDLRRFLCGLSRNHCGPILPQKWYMVKWWKLFITS